MRISMVKNGDGPFWSRLLFRLLEGLRGKVPPPLRAYGWKPATLLMFLGLGGVIRARGRLPERLKRLAMYWTARQVECSF